MLSIFDLIAILLALSAAFAYVNCKVLRLPNTIGVLVMGMAASLVLIGLEKVWPEARLYKVLTDAILRIDFAATFLNGMLAFLLFAGALHVDATRLRRRAITIGYLATAGVIITAAYHLWALQRVLLGRWNEGWRDRAQFPDLTAREPLTLLPLPARRYR